MHALPPINSPLLGHDGLRDRLSPPSSQFARKRPVKSYVALVLGACFGSLLIWTVTAPEAVTRLQDNVASLKILSGSRSGTGTGIKSQQSTSSPSSNVCDPFAAPGQLVVKQGEPDANFWKPWDPACNASTLFTDLRERKDLPWLHNKTIAILGDSIDRDHIEYFCEMSRGSMEWVWEGTRYDPPYTFSSGDPKPYSAADNGQDKGGGDQSRPRICYLEDYDFAVIFAFHFGLSDGGDGERNLPHFYPPFRFQDRLTDILVPILKSAERYPPTLFELGTGTWDLQHWTFEDREMDVDRMSSISTDRGAWYRKRFEDALTHVEDVFSTDEAEQDVAKTALVFREMQHTKTVDSVPPPRVHGLKNLQSLILRDRMGLDGRWQIDPLGSLLLGQEHYYRDSIHPIQLPAGKIWGDIMLHKLKSLAS